VREAADARIGHGQADQIARESWLPQVNTCRAEREAQTLRRVARIQSPEHRRRHGRRFASGTTPPPQRPR